ncbi:MAG: Mini-ribonuclease 3 [Clostridia bacterium]|nr:Mini-ribonuclease 3 [Clostridia bacterium]
MKNPLEYSPLVLAYIGDAVYEIYTRERILKENPNMPAHKLHLENIKYVKAHAQSSSFSAIEPILKEDEQVVFKRGRNAKSGTTPKNADVLEYHRATGLEALFGYLHLSGREERLAELMALAFDNANIKVTE